MKDWSKQTVVQLKAELKRRGLAVAGLKQELVARLTEHDTEAVAQEAEASPEPASQSAEQSAEPAEAPAEPAPIDTTPKDAAAAEPEPVAQEAVEPAAEASHEPTAIAAEADKQDTQATVLESITASDPTPPAPTEIAQDAQKRKRRSESPIESSESVSRKRIKADQDRIDADQDSNAQTSKPSGLSEVISDIKDALVEGTSIVDDVAKDAKDVSKNLDGPEDEPMEQDQPQSTEAGAEDTAMAIDQEEIDEKADDASQIEAPASTEPIEDDTIPRDHSGHGQERDDAAELGQRTVSRQDDGDAMEYERDVKPAVHPATRALYIKNFMRPLRENTVQAHLVNLATPAGAAPNDDDIEEFYLDQIKSHAFAVFRSTTQASRVRSALHDVIWPDERERKPLWVDFVPPEKVRAWIDKEETQGSRKRGIRWEVLYEEEDDGYVVARLDSGTAPPPALSAPEPARPAPSGPAVKDVNAIPLGPRGGRGTEGAPLGPRGDAPRGPGPRPPRQIPGFPGGNVQTTRANPPISFQPVSEDLASRRIRNMRSFYTQDLDRDMGAENEINRYTFEQGDNFVDRGQEVFIGIRPPHREAERRRQMTGGRPPHRGGPPSSRGGRRGGGGGGGGRRGPRLLSDRYLPGINESGPYRQGDRGNFASRGDDDRRSRPDDRGRRY
ncbi:hypothetical protein EsH8_VIII_000626 [Colletotrichum jinshuiense]